MRVQIIPAILVRSRGELLDRIKTVSGFVERVQIDIMDGEFVPNRTIQPAELGDLPGGLVYEQHLMVKDPLKAIREIGKPDVYIVHAETVKDLRHFKELKKEAEKHGGKIAVAINPPTPIEKIQEYVKDCELMLVMTVNPGFSGQRYIGECEKKIRDLRKMFPDKDIEVDGGVNLETIKGAAEAGANLLAAASALYASKDPKREAEKLKALAKEGWENGEKA